MTGVQTCALPIYLSAIEQQTLKLYIQQIADAIPNAITQFDKYGKAIDISTTAGRHYIEVQQRMMELANSDAIKEQTKKLKDYELQIEMVQGLLSSGTINIEWGAEIALTDNEIKGLQEDLNNLQLSKEATQRTIDNLKGIKEEVVEVKEETQKASAELSLEDYIKANEADFEKWKEARRNYIMAQERWEAMERKRAKKQVKEEQFGFEDEPDIQDDPELIRSMNLAQAELAIYQDSYQGRLDALNEMHRQGELNETQHQEAIYNLNQEYLNKKLGKYYNYLAASSQALQAYSTYQQAKMNKELAAAGKNEAEKDKIKRKYAKKQQLIDSGQALIKGAMAVMNLWGNNTIPYPAALAFNAIMTGVIAATTLAEIAMINSVQFATGNYLDVLGAYDKKKYRAQVVPGGTGLYDKPSLIPGFGLVGERIPELVFSGPDTQKIMDTPGLVEAINATVGIGQPVATREVVKETTTNTQTFTDPALISLMQQLNEKLSEPTQTFLVADEEYMKTHNKVKDEYDQFQQKVNG